MHWYNQPTASGNIPHLKGYACECLNQMGTAPSYLYPLDGWTRLYKGLGTEHLWQACSSGPSHLKTDMCSKACSCSSACFSAPSQICHSSGTFSTSSPSPKVEVVGHTVGKTRGCLGQPGHRPFVMTSMRCTDPWYVWPSFECCVKGKCKINRVVPATLRVWSSFLHRPEDPYFLTHSRQQHLTIIRKAKKKKITHTYTIGSTQY